MWVVFLIGGAGFFLQLSTYFGNAQLISASIFRITFDFPFSTWLVFSIPRSCGFFAEDGGLYENIANFQRAFLGVLKLYSQAKIIYLVSSQNSNSSRSTCDFSSCQ